MTREEALRVLVKMRAWRRWGKGEQNEKDRPEMPEQKEVDEAFNVCIEMLSKVSLPSSLDEAATNYAWEEQEMVYDAVGRPFFDYGPRYDSFKAEAKWMASQGVSTIAISSAEDGITEEGMKLIGDYLESLPDKTEVVLQIRKKQ